jgi:cell division protein FtsB
MKRRKRILGRSKKKFKLGINLDRRGWAILFVILSVPMALILKQLLEIRSLHERKSVLQQQINITQKEIERLEIEKQKLASGDPDTIEKLAREQHKFARPGEVILVPEDQKPPPAQ